MATNPLPYIFVSYAHKDSGKVLPVIQVLIARGYRVWYDDGIQAGAEWPEYIAQKLEQSSCVLAFMSSNADESPNCRREVNFALDEQKNILVINLDEKKRSSGMRMQLQTLQGITVRAGEDPEELADRLSQVDAMDQCKGDSQPVQPMKVRKPRHLKLWLIVGMLAVAIALLAILVFRTDPSAREPEESTGNTTGHQETGSTQKDPLLEQLEKTLAALEKVDVSKDSYSAAVGEAFSYVEDVWSEIITSASLKQRIYEEAAAYETSGEPLKAYLLYNMLDYLDSKEKAQQCYDQVYRVTHDGTKPGFLGIEAYDVPAGNYNVETDGLGNSVIMTLEKGGIVITATHRGFNAYDKLDQNDIIVGIDGQPVYTTAALLQLLEGKMSGQSVELSVYQKGELVTQTIVLGYRERIDNQ